MRTALREASIALDGRVLSTLALLRDLQTLLGDHLGQQLSDLPRSEERDAFVPNRCLATLTNCSSASSRASPSSSIDPADSRSRTPPARLCTMLPLLVG